jgi:hypothetical protein
MSLGQIEGALHVRAADFDDAGPFVAAGDVFGARGRSEPPSRYLPSDLPSAAILALSTSSPTVSDEVGGRARQHRDPPSPPRPLAGRQGVGAGDQRRQSGDQYLTAGGCGCSAAWPLRHPSGDSEYVSAGFGLEQGAVMRDDQHTDARRTALVAPAAAATSTAEFQVGAGDLVGPLPCAVPAGLGRRHARVVLPRCARRRAGICVGRAPAPGMTTHHQRGTRRVSGSVRTCRRRSTLPGTRLLCPGAYHPGVTNLMTHNS